MKTEIGEYVVGAYLKIILKCDFVDFNVRPIESGIKGLSEIDVVGIKLKKNKEEVFLCEVSTHLDGLQYGRGQKTTVQRIKEKHIRQKEYAKTGLPEHFKKRYMLWSPVVSPGLVGSLRDEQKKALKDLEIVANKDFTNCINELKIIAESKTKDFGNPFFRALQILEHIKK